MKRFNITESQMQQLLNIETTNDNGKPTRWDYDDIRNLDEDIDKVIDLSKITYKDKNGQDVPLFTNKTSYKDFAYSDIEIPDVQKAISEIHTIDPNLDISKMDKQLLLDIAENPKKNYAETILRLSELKNNDGKTPLLTRKNLLKYAKLPNGKATLALLQITRTNSNGETEFFGIGQIQEMQEAKVDVKKIQDLAKESYKDENGNTHARFGIDELYQLSDVDSSAINKLKDVKFDNGKPTLSGQDISILSKCKNLDDVIDMVNVRVTESDGQKRYNAKIIANFVNKGYSARDVQRLLDIKWNKNGTSLMYPEKISRLLDSGIDVSTLEKLYKIRYVDSNNTEFCFSADDAIHLAKKDFNNIYELSSMKYTDENGKERQRFSLDDIISLADYKASDIEPLANIHWNNTQRPILEAKEIKDFLSLGNTEKVARLLNIRTTEDKTEFRLDNNTIKELIENNVDVGDVERLANHKFKFDGHNVTLPINYIADLSKYDVNKAIRTLQDIINNKDKFNNGANLIEIAKQALQSEQTQDIDGIAKHYADMYSYYANLTDKNGKKIFDGRNGRMNNNEVLSYMASLPEVSKEATAVRQLTSLVQDGQVDAHVLKYLPKEGHINPLIAQDIRLFYDAYLNNVPLNDVLVPTRQSLSDIADVSTGDVFEVKGNKNIYIKNEDGTATQLQMDKATYCKLFPPIERYATTQNAIGNCWQIMGFNGVMREPTERLSVLETIRQDGDDIVVKFQNGRLGDIRFKNGKLPEGANPKYYSEGALGINMLEYAQGCELQRFKIDEQFGYLNIKLQKATTEAERTEISNQIKELEEKYSQVQDYTISGDTVTSYRNDNNHGGYDFASTSFRDGGQSNWTWSLLGYKNARSYAFSDYNARDYLAKPEVFKTHLIDWGSKGISENEVTGNKGIVSGHAYWLKANLDETGNIKNYDVLNPWGITETTLSLNEVMNYGDTIYVADRKNVSIKDSIEASKEKDTTNSTSFTTADSNSNKGNAIDNTSLTASGEVHADMIAAHNFEKPNIGEVSDKRFNKISGLKFKQVSGKGFLDKYMNTYSAEEQAKINELREIYPDEVDTLSKERISVSTEHRFTADEIEVLAPMLKENPKLFNILLTKKSPWKINEPRYNANDISNIFNAIKEAGENNYPAMEDIAMCSHTANKALNAINKYKQLSDDIKQKINAELANSDSLLKGKIEVFLNNKTIDENVFKGIDLINDALADKENVQLQRIGKQDIFSYFIMTDYNTIKNGISYLKQFKDAKIENEEELQLYLMFDLITNMLDNGKTFYDYFNNGYFDAFRELSNKGMDTEELLLKIKPNSSKANLQKNTQYILSEIDKGKFTTPEEIADVINYDVDYVARQQQLQQLGLDNTTNSILGKVRTMDSETLPQILDLLGNIPENIKTSSPDIIAEFINGTDVNLAEFNNYIKNIDTSQIMKVAPEFANFDGNAYLKFMEYHYKAGDSEFTKDNLALTDDFTSFLARNYVSAKNLTDIITAFPATDKNIGTLPEGWTDNIKDKSNVKEQLNSIIDKFRVTGEPDTRDVATLQSDLSNFLGKNVTVKYLDSGAFGAGYKVSVNGSPDVVLKIFHEQPEMREGSIHGQHVETQLGAFLNENSGQFAKFYFGRISPRYDNDGYLVTQFLSDDVTPTTTAKENPEYNIHSEDASGDHNIINGKIIDYGAVFVKKADGTQIPDAFSVAKDEKSSDSRMSIISRLNTANSREEFTALRDEIKKMPNGQAKQALYISYIKKYNQWSQDPNRHAIGMDVAKDPNVSMQKKGIDDTTVFLTNPLKLQENNLTTNEVKLMLKELGYTDTEINSQPLNNNLKIILPAIKYIQEGLKQPLIDNTADGRKAFLDEISSVEADDLNQWKYLNESNINKLNRYVEIDENDSSENLIEFFKYDLSYCEHPELLFEKIPLIAEMKGNNLSLDDVRDVINHEENLSLLTKDVAKTIKTINESLPNDYKLTMEDVGRFSDKNISQSAIDNYAREASRFAKNGAEKYSNRRADMVQATEEMKAISDLLENYQLDLNTGSSRRRTSKLTNDNLLKIAQSKNVKNSVDFMNALNPEAKEFGLKYLDMPENIPNEKFAALINMLHSELNNNNSVDSAMKYACDKFQFGELKDYDGYIAFIKEMATTGALDNTEYYRYINVKNNDYTGAIKLLNELKSHMSQKEYSDYVKGYKLSGVLANRDIDFDCAIENIKKLSEMGDLNNYKKDMIISSNDPQLSEKLNILKKYNLNKYDLEAEDFDKNVSAKEYEKNLSALMKQKMSYRDCMLNWFNRLANVKDITNLLNVFKNGKDFADDNISDILAATNKENLEYALKLTSEYKQLGISINQIRLILSNFVSLEQIQKINKAIGIEQTEKLDAQQLSIITDFIGGVHKNNIYELSKVDKRNLLIAIIKNKRILTAKSNDLRKLKDIVPLMPTNEQEYASVMHDVSQSLNISTEPLSAEKVTQFNETIKNLSDYLKTADLSELSEVNLSMSHKDFVSKVQDILKDLPKEEQAKIQDMFGFKIIDGKLTGYPKVTDDTAKLTDSKSKSAADALKDVVKQYSDNNVVTVKDNPELNAQLKHLSEVMPEIFNQIDGTQAGVEMIKTLQKVVQNPKFETLSDSDKKIVTVASLLHNTDKFSGSTSESAFDAYFIAKKFNMSDTDAQKVYKIIENSDAIEKFMATSKKETILNYYGLKINGQERENLFDLLAFNMKEGNDFELTQMLYSAKQPDGLTRHFDRLLQNRINEIKSQDFVLPQTSAQTYHDKAETKTIKRGDNEYNVQVVNASDIDNFYAFIHTPDAGLATGGTREANFANFDAFAVLNDDKVICTSYVTNEKASLANEYHNGFICDVENDKQYVGYGYDIFSLGKNIPDIIIEYYRDKGFKAGQLKGEKFIHRTMISTEMKSLLYGKDYRALSEKVATTTTEIHRKYKPETDKLVQARRQFFFNKFGSAKITNEQYQSIKNDPELKEIEGKIKTLRKQQNAEIEQIDGAADLREMDTQYREKLDNIKAKLGSDRMTMENIEQIDPDFAKAYKELLSRDFVFNRKAILNSGHHNEVLVSNPKISAIFTDNIEKIPEEYLKKAQEENLPIVIIK